MRDSGTRVGVLFASGDEGILWLERILGFDPLAELEREGVTLEVVDGPDHTFRPLWSHTLVEQFLDRLLTSAGFLDLAAAAGVAEAPKS